MAGLKLMRSLEYVHLSLASKSCIICSSTSVARNLQGLFREHSVDIQLKLVAADLGIDRGRVNASRPKQATRREAASKRLGKLQKLATGNMLCKRWAKKMALTAAVSKSRYSDKVHGTAPPCRLEVAKGVGSSVGRSR